MKTLYKIIPLLVVIPLSSYALENFNAKEEALAATVTKACKVPVKFNLHDYEYGTDEASTYNNRHFEDCSRLESLLAESCTIQPKNISIIQKIKEVYCMRGSMGERKLIHRKNGDLVFLIAYDSKNMSSDYANILKKDLENILKLDFKVENKAEIREKENKLSEAKAEKADAERDAKNAKVVEEKKAAIEKKTKALTEWFQAEVKKITSSPSPEMSDKLNKLTEDYKKKLNEL